MLKIILSRRGSRAFPVRHHKPVQWGFQGSPPNAEQVLHTQTYPPGGREREHKVTVIEDSLTQLKKMKNLSVKMTVHLFTVSYVPDFSLDFVKFGQNQASS